MNEEPLSDNIEDDADAWVIPLHGPSVLLPATADVPAVLQNSEVPDLNDQPRSWDLSEEELPTDLGFQPRLRRSA